MEPAQRKRAFRKALQAFRLGRLDEAAEEFRRLVEGSAMEALPLSYYGLLLALHEHRHHEGLEFCNRALVLGPDQPEVYLNLARVETRLGHATRALEVLRRGLRASPHDPVLMREIQQLSPRRRPPFTSLDRDHPLNRVLGKLRARVVGGSAAQ